MLNLNEIRRLIEEQEQLDADTLHLTANETPLSPLAQKTLSSPLHNRYLLEHLDMRGDSPSRLGSFLYKGLDNVNEIEQSATEVCKELFGAKYAEFRCLSGMHAMETTFTSLTKPGGTIMRISEKDGGHFFTQKLCDLLGRKSCCYAFDAKSFRMDVDGTAKIFARERPSVLYLDAMNYLFPFPVRELREIAGETPIAYDASHTLGLIAGGQFQDPLSEGADILQGNTHKTFFGPQKGIILGNNRELMEKVTYNLSSALVSSQHTASSLSLFIALHEMRIYGKEYAKNVIENSKYLAQKLYDKGLDILAADYGFTQNHMFFINAENLGGGLNAAAKLLQANISVNRTVPFEHVDAVRVGVQEITRLGYKKEDLDRVADWFELILLKNRDPTSVRKEISGLARSRRKVIFCEDKETTQPGPIAKMNESTKPRWIDCRMERGDIDLNAKRLSELREVAHLASLFSQQTDVAGNISTRSEGRIFVKASGAHLKDLKADDFVEILKVKDYTLFCKGIKQPSAEAYMHYLVYQNTASDFVVHNHYIPTDKEIRALNIAVIPPVEYGSIELAETVAAACKSANIVYIRRHGLVFHFKTAKECIEALQKFKLAPEHSHL